MALGMLKKPKSQESESEDEFSFAAPAEAEESPWRSAYKPSVSMIPPSVLVIRRTDKVKRIVFTAVAASAAIAVAGCAFIGIAEGKAREAASDQETITKRTIAEATRLAPVDEYYVGFVGRQQAVSGALNKDVMYAHIAQSIEESLLPGYWVKTLSTQFGTTCEGPNPFAAVPAIGCVNLLVVGDSITDAGVLATNLSSKPGMSDAYVTSVTAGSEGIEYLITVNYNAVAAEGFPGGSLSLKYQTLTQAQGQGDAGTEPVAPAPDTSTGEGADPIEDLPINPSDADASDNDTTEGGDN